MMKRTTLALSVFVAVGLVLAGCTGHPAGVTSFTDPPGATSAPPTTQAPSDPAQTSPDEARNAYLHYVDVRNAVTQDSFRDWETKFLVLSVGDERVAVISNWTPLADQGYRMVGSSFVKGGPDVLSYDNSDPSGNYRAEMQACVSTKDVEFVADGHGNRRAYPDGQFYYTIVMQRAIGGYNEDGSVALDPYGQGWWRVSSEKGDSERPC